MPLKFKWFKHWKCWHARTNGLWLLDARIPMTKLVVTHLGPHQKTHKKLVHSKNLPAPTDPATHFECRTAEAKKWATHGQGVNVICVSICWCNKDTSLSLEMLIGNIICLLSLLTSSRTILNPSLNWVGITGWQCIHIVLLWLWDQKIDKWYQLQRNATSKLAKFSTRKPARVTLDFHVCWICFILLIFPRRPGHRSRCVFPPALILAKTMYHLTGKNEKEKTSENSSQIMLPKTPIFHHANGGNPKQCILLWTWKRRWKWKGKAASMLNTWDAQRLRQKYNS